MKVVRTIPHMPPSWVYETRSDAGRALAREIEASLRAMPATVLAIPRGGVPVGVPIAPALDAPLDVTVPR